MRMKDSNSFCFLIRILIYTLLASLLAGCSTMQKPRAVRFKKISYTDLNGWQSDHHSWAFQAFRNSCDKILGVDAERSVSNLTLVGGSAIDWQVPCMEASSIGKLTNNEAREFFEKWFTPYQVYDGDGGQNGVLTGYYQIELEGSKRKGGKFKYPVYKKPGNLDYIKGTRNIDHKAINRGVLEGKKLEIAWVDNRAKLYLMHLQGSGVIKLKEGGEYFLGYDGHNGFQYKSITEALKDRDLQFRSSQSIYNWLHNNPTEGLKIIGENPSYVFFKNTQYKYAIGGQGVPLRAERSIAVDSSLYPYGAPVWVESNLPESQTYSQREYNRLLIAQDTGGAIKGAIRGDIFFGRGTKAEKVAMGFKAKTRFYLLFPKTVSVQEYYSVS
jgi:membrane-bound lytic murein transglycosylase A